MAWKKLKLVVNGAEIDAIAPTIISASRSTDIPAFHSEWFINRLRAGYVKWVNPFNRKEQYISFGATKFIVFWTKNAAPLMRYLPEIDRLGIAYYFNYTINDYEKEGLEPNLPPLTERINTFRKLSDIIGKERVIWRFDPLILTNDISPESLALKIDGIGNKVFTHTDRLVFSYVDIDCYQHVRRNLLNRGISYIPIDDASMISIALKIQELNRKWRLTLATCSEEITLNSLGIEHNKCIDGNLIRKIGGICSDVLKCNNLQLPMFTKHLSKDDDVKDLGQRKLCQCVESKDIGQYNSCGHLCVYCYANYSPSIVKNNLRRANVDSDSIL
ncbi:MAG: DUF1848 domain-containing protein [Syntrophobacteraceae bacterium]